MAGLNKVILIGNLGKDPEIKNLESGSCVANFSIATSETYKDKQGEKVEKTEWHNIVLWNKTAEIAGKYLTKGSTVCIEGKITTRTWENEQGEKRYVTEIVGSNLTMLGGKSNTAQPTTVASTHTTATTTILDGQEDDLPF